MKARMIGTPAGTSMIGFGLGLLAGVAAGALLAPMGGREMRASLRSRADQAWDRGMTLFEEGKRAFRTNREAAAGPALSATIGEIAQMHSGREALRHEAQS
jgi:gas vesicle protein